MEKTHWLPVLFIFTALFNLIVGYILTVNFGLIGAALARAYAAPGVTLYGDRPVVSVLLYKEVEANTLNVSRAF